MAMQLFCCFVRVLGAVLRATRGGIAAEHARSVFVWRRDYRGPGCLPHQGIRVLGASPLPLPSSLLWPPPGLLDSVGLVLFSPPLQLLRSSSPSGPEPSAVCRPDSSPSPLSSAPPFGVSVSPTRSRRPYAHTLCSDRMLSLTSLSGNSAPCPDCTLYKATCPIR